MKDILSQYGPEHHAAKHGPGSSGQTTDGGKPYCRPLTYSHPVGPKDINHEGPGLRGGENKGCGPQGRH